MSLILSPSGDRSAWHERGHHRNGDFPGKQEGTRRDKSLGAAPGTIHGLLFSDRVVGAQETNRNKQYPPMGRLVDVGGWRLHVNCTGTRNGKMPTVVLESGAGDFSLDWGLVQPEVARFARVCSYDRAGAGWSDLRPHQAHQ